MPLPLAARRSQVRNRTWSPSAAGPLPQQQQPLHSSRVALHPAPVSQRVRMPCEAFESDSSGQDRLLIQCRLYRRQFSVPATCRFELLRVRVRVRVRWRVPRRASFSHSFYRPPHPLQLLLTIAHQLLLSSSLCDLGLQPRLFRGVCFSVRPPPSRSLPPRRSRCYRLASRIFADGGFVVHLLSLRTLESLNPTQAASNPQLSNYIFNMYILISFIQV